MNANLIWIDRDFVLAVHRRQLERFGGIEGIRDEGLLDSALARPINKFQYGDGNADVAELAAAYAFGIARNHPFFDGNKRTALAVMMTFLTRNGHDLEATNAELIATFLRLAAGELEEVDLAKWVRDRIEN